MSLFGLLNLNKPAGMSSRAAVDVVQRLVRPAKAGHAGTLDPIATGVLVVCVGSATRLIPFAQQGRKVYRATFRLGVSSPTDDIEGVVTPVPEAPRLTAGQILHALPEFTGTIEQVPPLYSAVHVDGKRAYQLARRGETVELAAKPVEVHRFELVRFDDTSQELVTEIECGAGTYVRSLGRDLAKRLGSSAVMTALERTAVGPFTIADALPVADVTRESIHAHLEPAATAVGDLARVDCTEESVQAIRHGRATPRPEQVCLKPGDPVALFAPDGLLAAIARYEATDGTLRPKIVLPESEAEPT